MTKLLSKLVSIKSLGTKRAGQVTLGAVLLVLATAVPAQAQTMTKNGYALPGFLFSPGERRAREACAQGRPECRASVRAQMYYEMSISLIVPWALLGIAVLGVLGWMQMQEKKKQKARLRARAHHDPSKFRKLDSEREERTRNQDDDEDNL